MANPYYAWITLVNHFSKSEEWTPTQTEVFDTLYNTNIPIVGNPWKGAADTYYGGRKADEYRERHGIEGGGHDPRILADMSGSIINVLSGGSRGLNYVSRNLDMLYHDKPKRGSRHMSYEMAMDLQYGGY